MALCSLCRAIPFDSLPEPHPALTWGLTFDETEAPSLQCECERPHSLDNPAGHPWQPSLDALAASADTCGLCAIVQRGFEQWKSRFEHGQQTTFYQEYRDRCPDAIPVAERLWLTRRYGGDAGFVVLAKDPAHRTSYYLLTGVVFCVDQDNPVAQHLHIRPQDPDSGSDYSLGVAASFVHRCRDRHTGCRVEKALLPSRVLDTGQPDGKLRLTETHEELGIYACLSYCWGGAANFTTLRDNIGEKRSGFHLAELPRTLQDAVRLVRHLEIRYLWIDSVCICQDDREDWARESSRMMAIYSRAYLVIAANHAVDNAGGCFHTRPPRQSCRLDLPGYADDVLVQLVYNSDELDWHQRAFRSEPLSGRCWALQERILAPRILHYNSRLVYFECDAGIVSEDGSVDGRRFAYLDRAWLDENCNQTEPDPHQMWYSLISEYGFRRQTELTDKLPAMSGLAHMFARKIRAEYVAGIWSDALLEGLVWSGHGPNEPVSRDRYIAPSWSWASYKGLVFVSTGAREWGTTVAKVLDWSVQLKSDSNPFGEVVGASIQIRAPVVALHPVTTEDTEERARRERSGLTSSPIVSTGYGKGAEYNHEVELDDDANLPPEVWKGLTLKAMLIVNLEPEEGAPDYIKAYCYALVVIQADSGGPNQMQRVGWTRLKPDEADKIKEDRATWMTVDLI